jgi:signal transduction histidine kinase
LTPPRYEGRPAPSSAGWAILRSADRTIWGAGRISQPADDAASAALYVGVVHVRLPWLGRVGIDPVRLDWLLASVLTLQAELEIWLGAGGGGHPAAAAIVAPIVTGSVAVRRRYPMLVGTAVPMFAAVNHALWSGPQSLAYPIANLLALYALTAWTPPRRFAVGTMLVIATDLATGLAPGGSPVDALPFAVITLVVMLLVRRIVVDRERRARVAERERDLGAREAVVQERARIARELHDVIAHHVSIIVLQAGAERRGMGDENAATREVLETVEQTGRSALTEMRRLLGMLREEPNGPLAPQPGLRDLPMLVDQLREAGLPVELHVEGAPRGLPVGIELSAYRIVQEGLTNALKHAGHARATVSVRYGRETLELEINDDGPGEAPDASGGYGLIGMRERVALYGGRLEAGRRPSGGFAVRVLLPLE